MIINTVRNECIFGKVSCDISNDFCGVLIYYSILPEKNRVKTEK
jgi:hypothetical protein